MLGHEKQHCAKFFAAMPARGSRPCRIMSLWSLGGSLLGFLTALAGRQSIWVCTAAVEAARGHPDVAMRRPIARLLEEAACGACADRTGGRSCLRGVRLFQQYQSVRHAGPRTTPAARTPRPCADLSPRGSRQRNLHGDAHRSAGASLPREYARLDARRIRRRRRYRRIRRAPDHRWRLRGVPRLDRRLPHRWQGRHAPAHAGAAEGTRHRLRLHGRRRQDLPVSRQGRRA